MVRVLSEVGTLKYPESDLSFSPVLDNQWNNFLSILPQQRIRVDSCKIYIQGVSHHPAWLLCDPKTGRKFPLGQKHLVVSFIVSQIGDCLKEEFQDLGIFFITTFRVRIKAIWCKKWIMEAKINFGTYCILSYNHQILSSSLLLTIFLPQ